MARVCAHCETPLPAQTEGRPRRWCSRRCKERGALRRLRGLPENALLEGGNRGRLRLGQITRAERRRRLRELRDAEPEHLA